MQEQLIEFSTNEELNSGVRQFLILKVDPNFISNIMGYCTEDVDYFSVFLFDKT